jgi:hypothetical protein
MLVEPHARVKKSVHKVGRDVRHEDHDCNNHCKALHKGQVVFPDGLDELVSEPWPAEGGFKRRSTREQYAETETDYRNNRSDGIFQRMSIGDPPFA